MASDRTCLVEGCENGGRIVRGWCNKHWKRWRKYGDPLMLAQGPTPAARFWEKVDQNGPDGVHSQTGENIGSCWMWTAGRNHKGYGEFRGDGRRVYAHRFAYELLVSPIPDGLQLDHLCRVHDCVNPDHLEPVTSRTNTLRGDTLAAKCATKTHCLAGHPFSPENTYVDRGRRRCRECGRARYAAYRARKQAA
jgi:hypothetical protein